ncbi:MAG: hypothetical protein UHP11_02020 [Anaerovoracaceae bacterium]|nr:hypothetical protein [Anaerovoracaceae bacterium]
MQVEHDNHYLMTKTEIENQIARVTTLSEREWKRLRMLMIRNTLLTLVPGIAAMLIMR